MCLFIMEQGNELKSVCVIVWWGRRDITLAIGDVCVYVCVCVCVP